MMWLLVAVGAVAVAGVIVLVAYGGTLRHKTDDVRAEIEVLAGRAAELRALAGRLELHRLRRG